MKWLHLRKLEPLDYLIVIVVFLFGVVLFKFLNPNEQWIDVAVNSNGVPFFQANSLKIGDIEQSSSGKKIAEITNIQIYNALLATGSKAAQNDVFLNAKILVHVNSRTGEYEYKNKIIKVGAQIDFSFSSAQISGKVYALGNKKNEEKIDKILTLKMYSQWPWYADTLQIGESETDGTGQKIAELVSKEVVPAQITTTTSGGETRLGTDPQKVDLTLKIKIKIRKIGEDLIYKRDNKIIKGDLFSFNAGNAQVKDALIENIE